MLPEQDDARLLKRKEQNRAAQRAFRERKEKHVKDVRTIDVTRRHHLDPCSSSKTKLPNWRPKTRRPNLRTRTFGIFSRDCRMRI